MACKYCDTKIASAAPCLNQRMSKSCSERLRLASGLRDLTQARKAAAIINRINDAREESDHTLGTDCAFALQDAGIIP